MSFIVYCPILLNIFNLYATNEWNDELVVPVLPNSYIDLRLSFSHSIQFSFSSVELSEIQETQSYGGREVNNNYRPCLSHALLYPGLSSNQVCTSYQGVKYQQHYFILNMSKSIQHKTYYKHVQYLFAGTLQLLTLYSCSVIPDFIILPVKNLYYCQYVQRYITFHR